MNVSVITKDSIMQETISRFYPYSFSIEAHGLMKCVEKAIDVLNRWVYLTRHREYTVADIIPLLADVGRITRISYNTTEMYRNRENVFNFPPYTSNYNHPFSNEGIMMNRASVSLAKAVRGIQPRWTQVRDKLYLEDAPTSASIVHTEFYPEISKDAVSWELFSKEREFVEDYTEALASYREGRFLRKGKFLDAGVDADDMIRSGKDDMKALVVDWRASSTLLMGRK